MTSLLPLILACFVAPTPATYTNALNHMTVAEQASVQVLNASDAVTFLVKLPIQRVDCAGRNPDGCQAVTGNPFAKFGVQACD